jgi:hypothetical protein
MVLPNFKQLLTLSAISLCLFEPYTFAQSGATVGAIIGTIKDSQGNVIVGASIEITQKETNLRRNALTNLQGFYNLLQLPPGKYQLTVQAQGFEKKSETVVLNIGTTAILDVELLAEGTVDIVEVNAGGFIGSNKTESSTQIRNESINALPTNQRGSLSFAALSPRVSISNLPEAVSTASSRISINNFSGRFNNITIDGLSNNDNAVGATKSNFSQDAVQEFQVISDSYSAEFGRALSGVINVVTKDGTNEIHSSLFGFFRNKQTSARNIFFPFSPSFKRYQFGATLSAPIKKDKIFSFTSFERFIQKRNILVTVPDTLIESARRLNFPVKNGFSPVPITNTSLLGKLLFRLNQNDSLSIRYNSDFAYDGEIDGFGGSSDLTNGSFLRLTNQAIGLNNTYTSVANNFVNETRFLYAKIDSGLSPFGNGPRLDITSVEGSALLGRSRLTPQKRIESTYQIVNVTSLVRANHQIKFGVDFAYSDLRAKISLFEQGSANFQELNFAELTGVPGFPSFTGIQAFDPNSRTPQQLAFLSFLSGVLPDMFPGFPKNLDLANFSLPLFYTQGFTKKQTKTSIKLFSLFAQDDIRLKPNLILKAGIRYDLNRLGVAPKNNGNFSPRVALSFRPTSKLNITGAYGLFFASPITSPAILVDNFSSNNLTLLTLFLPVSVIPFNSPKRIFSDGIIPSGFNEIPQLKTIFTYDSNLRNSYAQHIKLGTEYTFNNRFRLFAEYIFIRGIKLFSSREVNPIVLDKGDLLTNQLEGRLDPSKGQIKELESAFDSYYHAGTIGLERNFPSGLSFLAHYTYSKTIDNFIDFSTNERNDPLNIGAERSLSLSDIRNNFVFSGSWKSKNKDPYLRNLTFSLIAKINSGSPFNLATSDLNKNGEAGDRPLGLGRNVGINRSFMVLDARIGRSFNLKDHLTMELYLEAFNLFNKANFFPIENFFVAQDSNGNFALPTKKGGRFILPKERITNSFDPRQIQLGFRLSF